MENEITILSVEKKKTAYQVITSQGDYILDEDIILRYYVFKDKVFSGKDFKKILSDQDITKNLQKVIRYLKYGARSEAEIKKYLGDGKGWVIIKKRLTDLGYIDDVRYAKTIVDYYIRSRKGPSFIQQTLFEKKVSKKIIDQALLVYTDEIEQDVIRHLLLKEQQKNQDKPIAKQKQLIISKLIRNGFSLSKITHELNEIDLVDQSGPKLRSDYEKLLRKFSMQSLDQNEQHARIVSSLLAKGYDYQAIRQVMKTESLFE
ncbi:MAG: RecX family transcriptional regulator [Bacilli bacterium]